jgi:integrase/recombinase XerD
MGSNEIYDYEKRLGSIESNIQNSTEVSQVNKKLILKFRDECFANNIGIARIVRYLYCLRDMARWINASYPTAKIQDLKHLVAKIERMDKYSPRTKYEYRATLKKFYKWMKNKDNPKEVAWLDLRIKKHNNKLPSDLPSEKDITEMINHTTNPRDRAIIIALYESGCRIGEFINPSVRNPRLLSR